MSKKDESFRDAMADVRPLTPKNRVVNSESGSSGTLDIGQRMRRDAALGIRSGSEDPDELTLGEVPQVNPRDILSWKKEGVQEAVFRKLRVGDYPIQAELDLHGLSVKEARLALYQFYQSAYDQKHRTLLVAHGRGERSQTPARLKSYVAAWLMHLPEVIAFHSAPQNRGGTGAVVILLRKPRRD